MADTETVEELVRIAREGNFTADADLRSCSVRALPLAML